MRPAWFLPLLLALGMIEVAVPGAAGARRARVVSLTQTAEGWGTSPAEAARNASKNCRWLLADVCQDAHGDVEAPEVDTPTCGEMQGESRCTTACRARCPYALRFPRGDFPQR